MNFNPEVNRWIKTRYREAPVSGPEASRIKFSDVLAEVQHAFPTMNVSTVVVSDAISKEFPMSLGKKVGEKRHRGVARNFGKGGAKGYAHKARAKFLTTPPR